MRQLVEPSQHVVGGCGLEAEQAPHDARFSELFDGGGIARRGIRDDGKRCAAFRLGKFSQRRSSSRYFKYDSILFRDLNRTLDQVHLTVGYDRIAAKVLVVLVVAFAADAPQGP